MWISGFHRTVCWRDYHSSCIIKRLIWPFWTRSQSTGRKINMAVSEMNQDNWSLQIVILKFLFWNRNFSIFLLSQEVKIKRLLKTIFKRLMQLSHFSVYASRCILKYSFLSFSPFPYFPYVIYQQYFLHHLQNLYWNRSARSSQWLSNQSPCIHQCLFYNLFSTCNEKDPFKIKN